jgi:hypothetical protein
MGWSGTNELLWGDAPQDIMDAAVKKYRLNTDTASLARRRVVALKLLADKALRARINRVYKGEIGRVANDREFRNLVRVTTNMGGHTVFFAEAKKARAKGKLRRNPTLRLR